MEQPSMRDIILQKLSYLNPQYMNDRSTFKTSLGFMGTFLERWLPQRFRASALTSIFNYLPLSDTLVTAGQPTDAQLATAKAAGFSRVINLAPHGIENALPDEAGTVTGLGMDYVHIPVDFKNPTEANFVAFCNALRQAGNQKVLVHCAANMRVSAFMFRYRTQVLGEDIATAEQDLHRIWKPFGAWESFIQRPAPQS